MEAFDFHPILVAAKLYAIVGVTVCAVAMAVMFWPWQRREFCAANSLVAIAGKANESTGSRGPESQMLSGLGEIVVTLPDGNRKHIKAEEADDKIKLLVFLDQPERLPQVPNAPLDVARLSVEAALWKAPCWFALLSADGNVFYGIKDKWVNHIEENDEGVAFARLKPPADQAIFDTLAKLQGETRTPIH